MLEETINGNKVLCKTDYVALLEMDVPKLNSKYYFLHEIRTHGRLIAILPYKNENGKIYYGLRKELCPPWSKEKFTICSLTGGIEEPNGPRKTAVLELKEEAGYDAKPNEFIFLGKSFSNKASDTIVWLYAIDVTGKEQGQADGDGTETEKVSSLIWEEDVNKSLDPLSYILYHKLETKNEQNN